MTTASELTRRTAARTLVFLALACLSIKSFQDLGGVRVLSLSLPLVLLAMFSYRAGELSIPRPVLRYAAFACVGLPLLSVVRHPASALYAVFLAVTVMTAIALILVATRKAGFSFDDLLARYADAMTVMCILSALTLEQQWFGGYTLRTFSDFATFFALQVSVGVPFLAGKYRGLKRLICLVALFFTFSRLSFVIVLIVIAFQMFRENRAALFKAAPVVAVVLGVAAVSTDMGSLMAEKLANVVLAASGSQTDLDINPSDRGRLAYALVTLDALSDASHLALGHGIKTNHEIIGSELDTSIWGLDPEMADATVHNVYLELLSDVGLLGACGMCIFLGYAGIAIKRRFGAGSPQFLSWSIFVVSYLFEANYVSFFFQFFVCAYLWMAVAPADSRFAQLRVRPARTPAASRLGAST